MIKTKIVSSLEKVFLDQNIDDFHALNRISALIGERFSIQLLYSLTEVQTEAVRAFPKISGALSKFVKLHTVNNVPVIKSVNYGFTDENYLRTSPGLFPDLLVPLDGELVISSTDSVTLLESLWLEIDIPEDCNDSVGESELKIVLVDSLNGETLSESSITVDLIGAVLPKQELILTQWFHCDCLASYYDLPVWSKRHWEVIENFATVAVKNGINMLLTPIFTPPLDTPVGGERPTVQLVDVRRKNGRYSFGFSKLDKWIDMCNRVGIKYLEISHLFTQWGAAHAPKIMATVDGEYKRIFGWDTDAHSEEYREFLRTFIKAFIRHMKKRGDDQRCYYHISDEPNEAQLENYKKSKAQVEDLLENYTIMDALSSYEFYNQGVVKTPIPSNDHIAKFIENGVPGLWTYYCCAQCVKVSNRLVSMPSWRNRSIGMQMYKYDIKGFLQWGYNFYYNRYSLKSIQPYNDLSGEKWVPAGDPFSVYPGRDGQALESLRILVFAEALCDMRAMKLCESLYSKAEVVCAIEKELGDTLTFDRCALSADEMHRVRESINLMIKNKIK